MDYQDKDLSCKECGAAFAFTASEQAFYAEKGFQNDPSRCPDCRAARKRQNGGRMGGGNTRPQREMFDATCSACGIQTQVPFRPTAGKPVYCRDCFQSNR
ncbi:zinc-ribbon domain containing protein [Sporomusa sp.]|uniref:zinc-ribbon domain containing protein n=1 Tax=Sporomusa sp. TaxID=2078658 RepID=UPI002C05E7EB|nr:zinc-ribbon domain containing protein [Sporomusa sp.]HWR41585.1 zinc-ribbon domain containing protein [Sporomusa sp.]